MLWDHLVVNRCYFKGSVAGIDRSYLLLHLPLQAQLYLHLFIFLRQPHWVLHPFLHLHVGSVEVFCEVKMVIRGFLAMPRSRMLAGEFLVDWTRSICRFLVRKTGCN